MKRRLIPGINIQWPISELIMNRKKIIETRTYPLPEHLIGKELAVIETPGRKGKFKARVIGVVKFQRSFQYKTKKDFYADSAKHCVTPESEWKWVASKQKWGWPVTVVAKLNAPTLPPKSRGIIFASNCSVRY